MRKFEEHYKAAKEKAEQQKRKRLMVARQNVRREQAINNRRCFEVGRIICERFPELRKYQPQYRDAISDMIYDELIAIVDFLATNRELLDQIKVGVFGESSKHPQP